MPSLAEMLDPEIETRGSILPLGLTRGGGYKLAVPGSLVDMLLSMERGGKMAVGDEPLDPNAVTDAALNVGMGGSLGVNPGGAVLGMGPRLTKKQYEDFAFSNSKKRKKWSDERKEEYRNNAAAIEAERTNRKIAQTNSDPLMMYGGGQRRLEEALKLRHAEQAAVQAAEKYGVERNSLGNIYGWQSPQEIERRAIGALRAKKTMDLIDSASSVWNKSFSDAARKTAAYDDAAGSINRANMEAAPRVLSRDGWTTRHASTDKSGLKSSRYLVSPDGAYEIRLSDHYLPDTPQRAYNTEMRGTRWNDELVLTGREHPSDVIDEIKNLYSRWLAEK
jgi:hypothetical protein